MSDTYCEETIVGYERVPSSSFNYILNFSPSVALCLPGLLLTFVE